MVVWRYITGIADEKLSLMMCMDFVFCVFAERLLHLSVFM